MKNYELQILFEDEQIIVCIKPHGVPTQTRQTGTADMVSILKNHIFKQGKTVGEPYLAVIHRLDQPVKGILVFAKTSAAAKELNHQLQSHGFGKYYRALVWGIPIPPAGTLEDYLTKDGQTNTSRICSRDTVGAKLARLQYDTVDVGKRYFQAVADTTELHIKLDTGRHHQIRVQLAHLGCPIVGDTKYSKASGGSQTWPVLLLCAYKLSFRHPLTKKALSFQIQDN